MLDVDDPAFLAYLGDENRFSATWFGAHDATVEAIFGEIKSRIRETDQSTPVLNGGWWYVSSTIEGEDYPRHHRGRTADTATDPRAASTRTPKLRASAPRTTSTSARSTPVDGPHGVLAWSTDTDRRRAVRHFSVQPFSMTVISTVGDVDDQIVGVANAGTAWSAGRRGGPVLRSSPDEQERPCRGLAASAGIDLRRRRCVHSTTRTMNGSSSGSATTRSDRLDRHPLPAVQDERRGPPACRRPLPHRLRSSGRPGAHDDIEYSVDDWGDRFVIVTNTDADDFRVLTAPVDDELRGLTDSATWTELIAHEPGRRITGVEPFRDHLLVHEWAAAQPQLRVLFHDGSERAVEMGAEPHDIDLSANPEWEATTFRLVTQSLSSPLALFEEQVGNGERTLLRRIPTPNVDIESYRSTRLWAPSVDGVEVPIDVVHHVDTPLDGTAPGVLYGYGSYEASLPPWFSVARLSLLDRGHVWALAHPRGGGELGRQWYLDGKLEQKQHTFDDMLACAEHLVTTRVVAHTRLAIRGGSAGGLLVGACMTQRPDLFASVVAEVPFVDIVSTMSDPTLPLTVTEWEEWGDPRREPFASVMEAYSPYDNVRAVDYPAVYVTAGMNDPRVSVHEPAKFVARLRSLGTGSAPVVMRTEMGSGHGGPSGRYDAWRDEARTLAFLLATT